MSAARAHVSFEILGEVALVGLARPDKRNAISDELIEGLGVAVERARGEAKAAVLFGEGAHFSAGLDLSELGQKSLPESVASSQHWNQVFDRVEFGPIPWFCALHGAVVGGGLELAAATHVRIADESSFFGLPEGQRGIFVGGGGSVRVTRLIGVSRMMDMMLTGRTASPSEAERWGAVQYVVPQGEAKSRAIALAAQAARHAPVSTYCIINALPRIPEMSRGDGLFAEAVIAAFAANTPEARERLNTFLTKRAPKVSAPD